MKFQNLLTHRLDFFISFNTKSHVYECNYNKQITEPNFQKDVFAENSNFQMGAQMPQVYIFQKPERYSNQIEYFAWLTIEHLGHGRNVHPFRLQRRIYMNAACW